MIEYTGWCSDCYHVRQLDEQFTCKTCGKNQNEKILEKSKPMKKAILNRIILYVIYVAFALLFWYLDLNFVMGFFIFLLAFDILGIAILWLNQIMYKRYSNTDVTRTKKGIPDFKHTPPPPRKQDVTEEVIVLKGPLTEDQKKELKAQLQKWHDEGIEFKIDKAASQEFQ